MIDVTSLGATGDGTTDDTAALQSALDGGGHIYVPGGTYRIAGTPLRIRENAHLQLAPDARIVRDSGPGLIRNRWPDDDNPGYTGRGNILIEGGTWDLRGDLEGVTQNAASGMTMAHAERITIRDLTILNVPKAHGLDLIGCRNVRIERVVFAGYLADPADTQPRESVQIDGAFASYSGDCAPYDSTPCEDVLVSACRFQPSADLPAPQRAVGSHGYLADVSGHEHSHIRVIGNMIHDVTDSAVAVWCWQESLIFGNTIWSPGKDGVTVRDRAWHIDIAHNQVIDAGKTGIYLNGTVVNNITVHGNTIVGSGRVAPTTSYGIGVENNVNTVGIASNRVVKRGSGNNAKYGLYISGSCSGMRRFGNDLRTSGVTASLQDSSPSPLTAATDAV